MILKIMCIHPLRAFPTGLLTEKGKDDYFISTTDDFVIPGWQVAKRKGLPAFSHDLTEFIEIPCGKCVGCKKDRARKWAFRCLWEASENKDNYFVTLTYDNEHLPPFDLLVKSDLQNFFKRLRSAGYKFRYFACGEHGEKRGRQHFHVLFFGLNIDWSRCYRVRGGNMPGYRSPELEKHWPFGFVDVSPVSSPAAVGGYVSKYIMKGDEEAFCVMSRKPGIGFNSMLEFVEAHAQEPAQWQLLKLGDHRGHVQYGGLPRSLRERLGMSPLDEVTQACIVITQNKMRELGYKDQDLYNWFAVGDFRIKEGFKMRMHDVARNLGKV